MTKVLPHLPGAGNRFSHTNPAQVSHAHGRASKTPSFRHAERYSQKAADKQSKELAVWKAKFDSLLNDPVDTALRVHLAALFRRMFS